MSLGRFRWGESFRRRSQLHPLSPHLRREPSLASERREAAVQWALGPIIYSCLEGDDRVYGKVGLIVVGGG